MSDQPQPLKTKLATGRDEKRLVFWCPGCDEPHTPRIDGNGAWVWNGDRDRPTLSPSVLVTDASGNRCHSFVKDGQIQFLSDCTHNLVDQIVAIPDWPYQDFGGLDDE